VKRWIDRPVEIRNLFNPAFCGVVLFRAISGFSVEDKKGMPFSLSLLVLPLSLHQSSRETLQRAIRSYFLKAIAEHPELLVDFGSRCKDMLPFSHEALGLLMHCEALTVSAEGRLLPGPAAVRKTVNGSDESKACQRVAAFVGKEFARIADRGTIYATLGIRP
jgi:Family of unknown function (DUF6521)